MKKISCFSFRKENRCKSCSYGNRSNSRSWISKNAGLEIGETGAIKVNSNYRTNDEDIYAVGDAIEVYNALTSWVHKLSLAGPAQKAARTVADHINGKTTANKGYIGSSAIKVFDYNAASTGLNEALIKVIRYEDKIWYSKNYTSDKVGIMPDSCTNAF